MRNSLLIALCVLFFGFVNAQTSCSIAPIQPPTGLSNNCSITLTGSGWFSVNSGQKACVPLGKTFTGGVNMNGGTIVGIGNFSPSNINQNSGLIIVVGSGTVAGMNMNGTSKFQNYGSLKFTIWNFGGTIENFGSATVTNSFNVNSGSTLKNYGTLIFLDNFNNNAVVVNSGSLTINKTLQNNSGSSFTNNCTLSVIENFNNNSVFNNNGSMTAGMSSILNGAGTFNVSSNSSFITNSLIVNSKINGPTSGNYAQIRAISTLSVNSSGNIQGKVDICSGGTLVFNGIAGGLVTRCDFNKSLKMLVSAYSYSIPVCQTSPLRIVIKNTVSSPDTFRLKNVFVQQRLRYGLTYQSINSTLSSQGVQYSNYDVTTNKIAFRITKPILAGDSAVVVFNVKADCNLLINTSSNNALRADTIDVQVKQGTLDTLASSVFYYGLRSAFLNIDGTPPAPIQGRIGEIVTRRYTMRQTSISPNNQIAVSFTDSLPNGVKPISVRIYKQADSLGYDIVNPVQHISGNKINYSASVRNLTSNESYIVEERVQFIGCPAATNSTVKIKWGCDTTCFYNDVKSLSPSHALLDSPNIQLITSITPPPNAYCAGTNVPPTHYRYRITNTSNSPALNNSLRLAGPNNTIATACTVRFSNQRLRDSSLVNMQLFNGILPNQLNFLTVNTNRVYVGDTITVDVDYRISCSAGPMDKWKFTDGWEGVCPGHGGGTGQTFNGDIDGNNFNLISAPSSVSTIDTFTVRREFFQQSQGSFFPYYGKGVTTTYPRFNDTTGVVRIHMDFGEGIMFPDNLINDASFVLFDNNGAEQEWLPYKAIPDPSFGVGRGGLPRGADFYFRLSDAKIANYTWADFLGSSRLYYRFKGYCPAAQPNTQVNYGVFLKGDTLCTAGCEIAMATSQTLINVKCPGCKVPGPVASMELRRESFGFTDNNRDGFADLPLTRVNPNGLQINPAMAAVGDTISLTIRGNLPNGDNNGGIELNNLVQQLGPLKYIYLEAKGFPALNKSIRALDTFQVIIKRGANTVGARTFRTKNILQSVQNGTFFFQIPVDSMGYTLAINDFFYLRTNFVIQRNMLDVVTYPEVVPKQINVTLGIGNKSLNNKDEAVDGANGNTYDPTQKYFFYCEADSRKFTFVPYDTAAFYQFYFDPYSNDVCNKHMSLYAIFTNLVDFPYEFRKSATIDTMRFNIPPDVNYKDNIIAYFNKSQGRPFVYSYPNVSAFNNQVIFTPRYSFSTSYSQGIIPLNSGSTEFQGSALYERNCNSNASHISFTFPDNTVSITLPDSGKPIAHPRVRLKPFDEPYGRFFYNDTTHEVFSDFSSPAVKIDAVTDNISTSPDTLLPFSIRSTNGIEAINVFMDVSTRGSNRFVPQQLLEIKGSQIVPIAKPTGSQVFQLDNVRAQRQFRIVGTYTCRSASDKKDTLLIRYGWRCGGYPNKIDTASCAYNKLDTAYYYINTSEAGIQLPTQISGPDSLNMCGTNTFSYTMNPLGEKVYNFHNSMTLPVGVTVDSVIYSLNNVNYPSPFTVSQNKVTSISDQASGLTGVGIRAGTSFKIKYVLRFPCGFNLANNTLKVSAFGFSYCGLKVPANDSLTSVFPSKIKGLTPPKYTVSVPKTVNMGCLDITEVQIKVTPTVASNRPGRDTIRILVPKELELSLTPKFSTIKSGTLFDTLRLALPSIPQIGVAQTISFYISRAQGLPYCGKRDIQTEIVSGRGLVCSGVNCSVSFNVSQAQFSSVNLLACGLATPIVSGVSESCGNTAQTYTITNTYSSGTSYAWSVSSYANNKNLTVAPNASGVQGQVTFGDKPGVDTLIVSAYNSSGCASASLKLPITTNPLPLNQSNISTRLYVDYSDGKGEILKDKRQICVGNQIKLEAKSNTTTLTNRLGVPINTITYSWNLTGANIIPVIPSSATVRNISYSSTGNYPFAFNGSNAYGCSQSIVDTFKVKNLVCGECLNARDSSNLLGIQEIIRTPIIDASTYPGNKVVFDGNFAVRTNLTLRNGTFIVKPNSKLIMDTLVYNHCPLCIPDGPILGAQIYFENAKLIIQSSTLSGCSITWEGLYNYDNISSLSITGTKQNKSIIKDALWNWVDVFDLYTNYVVFLNNRTSLLTKSQNISIKNSLFTSNPITSYPPYNRSVNPSNSGYSYYHSVLLGLQDNASNITIDSSTFENSNYGIWHPKSLSDYNTFHDTVSNKLSVVKNSNFKNIGTIGLNTGLMKWVNNQFTLINNSNEYTYLKGEASDRVHFMNGFGYLLMNRNMVSGSLPIDGTVSLDQQFIRYSFPNFNYYNILNNTFNNISKVIETGYFIANNYYGTYYVSGQNPVVPVFLPNLIKGNNFINCDTSVIYTAGEPYIYQTNVGQVPQNLSVPNACNTYTSNKPNSVAVLLNAQVPNNYTIGTPTAPAGNSFNGYDGLSSFGVYNQGQPFTYYYGSDQNVSQVVTGGPGLINLVGRPLPSNCSGQGYSNGVGRLAYSESEEPNVRELQDSVRFRGTTPSRIKLFQSVITKHYTTNNNLDSLGTYTKSLVNCNREAYYSFCLYLINKYTAMGDVAKATSWKSLAKQPNSYDREINARIAYLEMSQNRPALSVNKSSGFLPNGNLLKYSSIDSTQLANLANSGTSVAEGALGLLRIAYPRYNCNARMTYNYRMYDTLNCDTEFAFARKAQIEKSETTQLGEAVPNPANQETSISYVIQEKNVDSRLEIFDLGTGKKQQTFELSEDENNSSIVINVEGYSPGVYGYRLIVGDKIIGTKKLVVVK